MSVIRKIAIEEGIEASFPMERPAYRAKPACWEVEVGVFYGSGQWLLKEHMRTHNRVPSAERIDFHRHLHQSAWLSSRARDRLIVVQKDHHVWERQTLRKSWETIRNHQSGLFAPLYRFMSAKGYVALLDFTPDAALAFVDEAPEQGRHRSGRLRFLSELHQLWRAGLIPDGLGFDPSLRKPKVRRDPSAVRRSSTKARPMGDEIYLAGLAAAIRFIRRWKADIIAELEASADGREPGLSRFEELATIYSVRHYGFWAIVRHFQRACYIIVASTLIGRVNEFLNLTRGCCSRANIDGEPAIVIELAASKWRDEPSLELSLGIELTAEAIEAINQVVEAHPEAKSSPFLFANLKQFRKNSRKVGVVPIGYDGLTDGLPDFLEEFAGVSPGLAATVKCHRFRATSMMKLCRVRNGVVAAFRQSHMVSIAGVGTYTMPEAVEPAIQQNLNDIARGEAP